jgi:uncharacterized membrane protein
VTPIGVAADVGVFWGTWFSLSRTMGQLPAETFLAVGHQMIHNLGVPMAILLPLALLSALGTLVLLWQGRPAAAWWWLLAGFLLLVAALAITLIVEVPIDNQIRTWTAATLPGDWRSIQARWERFHTLRTFLSIAAVAAATISAVVARPNQPPTSELSAQVLKAERYPGSSRRDHGRWLNHRRYSIIAVSPGPYARVQGRFGCAGG